MQGPEKPEQKDIQTPNWFNFEKFKTALSELLRDRQFQYEPEKGSNEFFPIESFEDCLQVESTRRIQMTIDGEVVTLSPLEESFEDFRLDFIRIFFRCIDISLLPDEWHSFIDGFKMISQSIQQEDVRDFIPNLLGDVFETTRYFVLFKPESSGESFDYRTTFSIDPADLQKMLLEDLGST